MNWNDRSNPSATDLLITLGEKQIKELKYAIEKINKRELPDDEKALTLADLHTRYGFNFKAIKILEERMEAGSKTADIYLHLGDLYKSMGSYSSAQKQYTKTLELLKAEPDLEECIVKAKAGLAEIMDLFGNKK